MITRVNKVYESIKTNSDVRNHEIKGKETKNVSNNIYNPKSDYSFLDLDRLIMAVIERHLEGDGVTTGLGITTPKFQNQRMNKRDLEFSREFFDIINPLVQSAYEKRSLGDLEYHKYEEYIALKVADVASVVRDVVQEFSDMENKPTYDEHSLRKSADDYFIDQINKTNIKNIENELVANQNDRIGNISKMRIMNDKDCLGILAELKTLI